MSQIEGDWQLAMQSPMGRTEPKVTLRIEGSDLSGTFTGQLGTTDFSGGTVDGNELTWTVEFKAMGRSISMNCKASIDGDKLTGQIAGPRGTMPITGKRISS